MKYTIEQVLLFLHIYICAKLQYKWYLPCSYCSKSKCVRTSLGASLSMKMACICLALDCSLVADPVVLKSSQANQNSMFSSLNSERRNRVKTSTPSETRCNVTLIAKLKPWWIYPPRQQTGSEALFLQRFCILTQTVSITKYKSTHYHDNTVQTWLQYDQLVQNNKTLNNGKLVTLYNKVP